jgi:hypothetical protein
MACFDFLAGVKNVEQGQQQQQQSRQEKKPCIDFSCLANLTCISWSPLQSFSYTSVY